jgi:hypothetical protein
MTAWILNFICRLHSALDVIVELKRKILQYGKNSGQRNISSGVSRGRKSEDIFLVQSVFRTRVQTPPFLFRE